MTIGAQALLMWVMAVCWYGIQMSPCPFCSLEVSVQRNCKHKTHHYRQSTAIVLGLLPIFYLTLLNTLVFPVGHFPVYAFCERRLVDTDNTLIPEMLLHPHFSNNWSLKTASSAIYIWKYDHSHHLAACQSRVGCIRHSHSIQSMYIFRARWGILSVLQSINVWFRCDIWPAISWGRDMSFCIFAWGWSWAWINLSGVFSISYRRYIARWTIQQLTATFHSL